MDPQGAVGLPASTRAAKHAELPEPFEGRVLDDQKPRGVTQGHIGDCCLSASWRARYQEVKARGGTRILKLTTAI